MIGGIHDRGISPLNNIAYSTDVQSFISELSGYRNVIMTVFKNPYTLDKLHNIEQADGLIITYEDNISMPKISPLS